MSFGGGFGGGGFGSTNNQSTGFGGGFGSSNPTGGFGQQSTGFGTNATTGGGSVFGSGGSGFGPASTAFNAPKAFGNTAAATTGGSLFGGNTSAAGSTGFGGFGSTANNTTGFGAATTGNNLFSGGNKTGFGGAASTGGGLFGTSSSTGAGFGTSSSSGGLFGNSQAVLGGNIQECQGTGNTPFSVTIEKEQNNAVANHYQSITCMQPYQKWSFEELRLADYNAGRRFGNGSGQAGAFGASAGFGGFGQSNSQATGSNFGGTSSGLFGQQTSSGGFGTTTQTAGGFGGAGGLFGQQNKPATGGLFGSGATTGAPAGGAFGTSGGTSFAPQPSGSFGSTTGASLFGNNQSQQKPGGLFGQSNTSGTAGFNGFGNPSANTGGNLFGGGQSQTQSNPLFGNNQQQPSGGLFGQQNQNQTQTQNQGSTFGGFGQNTLQKPGGLFGNNNTTGGGGLFGQNQNNQQPQTGTGLFGQSGVNNNQGLFGQKPAQTGGGLFGQNANPSAGGGLFGPTNQNTQQPNQSGGLFGAISNSGNNSLFNQKPAQAGTSLFGSAPQPSQANGLFGTQNNQSQNNAFSLTGQNNNSSTFGVQQNDLQGPPALTASAADANPYGSASIFSGLPQPTQQNPGPVATPISAGHKQKKPAALPQFKINPTMASRFSTPQKRGYGFTYSTYGTPSSISSAASTPGGLSSSLLANSLGRSLGKSFSTSNLRRTFDTDGDSILSPGAFSANSNRYGAGSLKRLNIDRSLRTDLFGTHAVAALPAPERNETSRSPSIKKKVSFDASTVGGTGPGFKSKGEVESDTSAPSTQEQGSTRSRGNGTPNGQRSNPGMSSPTKDSGQNAELTTVHEDGSPQPSHSNALIIRDQNDPEIGEYWTSPTLEELKKFSRERLRAVPDFQVGRESCGQVAFERPVDLTTVDLDSICGTVIVIELRSLTVYPTNVSKPPVGQGLNVPSLITLENSWPRQRDKKTPSFEKSGPRFEKHVKRLSMVSDTEFVSYNADSGEWTFRVPHFTTYGLDYDDDETTEQSDVDAIEAVGSGNYRGVSMSDQLNSNAQEYLPMSLSENERSSFMTGIRTSKESVDLDDTFDFKKRLLPPGAFDEVAPWDDDSVSEHVDESKMSFLGERSVALLSDDEQDEPSESHVPMTWENAVTLPLNMQSEDVSDIVGSFPVADGPTLAYEAGDDVSLYGSKTPPKTLMDHDMDWVEQLQQTVSPNKKDRYALRQSQLVYLKERINDPDANLEFGGQRRGGEITTSIDLMDSLFGTEIARRNTPSRGFTGRPEPIKMPFPETKSAHPAGSEETNNAFHASFKPSWSGDHQLTYVARDAPDMANRDVRKMKFERARDITATRFQKQREQTEIRLEDGVPKARARASDFKTYLNHENLKTISPHERLIWELGTVLFDEIDSDLFTTVPNEVSHQLENRLRKDRLSAMWSTICEQEAKEAVAAAQHSEERAIAFLSAHKISEACAVLVEGKDYRLATLIAQIGEDQMTHDDMSAQIEDWRQSNILSEIADPIRTLYELLAGNTCLSAGKRGPLEDRCRSFCIPERYNMGWRRAFGLELWYGISADEPLEEAVRQYLANLSKANMRKPLPCFLTDKGISLPWKDPEAQNRQDVLWSLLKAYTYRLDPASFAQSLSQAVMPENTVGLPMSHRLSFELYRKLAARFPYSSITSLGDRLSVCFAAELEAADQWVWAIFSLLHISDWESRQHAIQSVLARHAEALHESDKAIWSTLVDEFKIPEKWLWESMALFARSTLLATPETTFLYLLKADEAEAAHEVLLESVAPLKVIERDYLGLQKLLHQFNTTKPDGWRQGGGLYSDFCRFVEDGLGSVNSSTLVSSLVRGLSEVATGGSSKIKANKLPNDGFLPSVALRVMCQEVGDVILAGAYHDNKDQAAVLQLPINPETKTAHARILSWKHYRKIMAASH